MMMKLQNDNRMLSEESFQRKNSMIVIEIKTKKINNSFKNEIFLFLKCFMNYQIHFLSVRCPSLR